MALFVNWYPTRVKVTRNTKYILSGSFRCLAISKRLQAKIKPEKQNVNTDRLSLSLPQHWFKIMC